MHFTLGVVVEKVDDLDKAIELFVQGTEKNCTFNDRTKEDFDEDNEGFDSLEEYLKYYGCLNDGNGRQGETINPDTEMDSYEIGGGWRGSLLIKDDVTDFFLSEPWKYKGTQRPRQPVDGYRWVDAARIRDIEWEKMLELEHPIKFFAFVGLEEDWMATEINEHKAFMELLEEQDEDCFLVVTDCHV